MNNPFEEKNRVNDIWLDTVSKVLKEGAEVKPRGMLTHEIISGKYKVPMPAFLDLKSRDVKVPFMFAEAAWIISGSNRLADLTPYMKVYSNFSDDNKFLRGAYGPKVVDQLPYVVQTLTEDQSSRQAVMTIWRERPGPSRDIPCTVAAQFLIRDDVLHMVVTMRSNDIVLGFTYDVFTFSMIANAVRLLLKEQGIDIILGDLIVNAGSLHIYERHFDDYKNKWEDGVYKRNLNISHAVMEVMAVDRYEDLIDKLKDLAHDAKFYPERY
jgi:thymidylate synthase